MELGNWMKKIILSYTQNSTNCMHM